MTYAGERRRWCELACGRPPLQVKAIRIRGWDMRLGQARGRGNQLVAQSLCDAHRKKASDERLLTPLALERARPDPESIRGVEQPRGNSNALCRREDGPLERHCRVYTAS